MDNAADPFAPLTPAEIADGAQQGTQPKCAREAKPTCPPADAENGALAAARLFGRKPDGHMALCDCEGETAFYAARWNEADGQKTFRPIHGARATAGNSRLGRIDRPLYNLPAIVEKSDAPIIICEGEKAAEAAARDLSQEHRHNVERRRGRGGQNRLVATRPAARSHMA